MEKCLITKFNKSINRDDLPVLGKIRINITGTNNTAQSSGISGQIIIVGSSATWKGNGVCNINSNDNITYYCGIPDKTSKGILFINNKYELKKIETLYAHGANINFEDINKYCKEITTLIIANSGQEGDLAALNNLSNLKMLDIGGSKVTGDLSNLQYISNFTRIHFSKTSIACDLSLFANNVNLVSIDVSNTSTTGNLSVLAALDKVEYINATSSGVEGDLSLFANKASLKTFNYWELENTWNSDSLRPSSMSKITGAFKFKTAADTDNFLKNMAKCSDEGVDNKVWYFQNSHRTSASNAAVSTLQSAGYTLSQLITD